MLLTQDFLPNYGKDEANRNIFSLLVVSFEDKSNLYVNRAADANCKVKHILILKDFCLDAA